MATVSTRKKATRKGKGARRDVAPVRDRWPGKAAPERLGWEQFRFRLYREKRRLPSLSLDGLATSASWTSGKKVTAMSIGVQRPEGGDGGTLGAAFVAAGDTVRCEVDVNGDGRGWVPVWDAVVGDPIPHTLGEGSYTLPLKPFAGPITEQSVSWKYRKDRARPHGWTAAKVTRSAARRFRVPVGPLPRATHPITKLVEKKASVREIVQKAWDAEADATGRQFVVDWVGRLSVVELREPDYMRVLGPSIVAATVERSLKGVYSAAIVVGSRKVGGKRKRYRVKVVNAARQQKYGYIVRTVTKSGLSAAGARRYGREKIARAWRNLDTVTLSHPGIPWVRYGDACRIELPEDGIAQVAFVKNVEHSLSSSGYDMELEVSYADPWEDAREARAKKKREAARKKRKRAGGGKVERVKAKKAGRRS